MITLDKAIDLLVLHRINFERYSDGVVRRMAAQLNKADADIFARMLLLLEDMPRDRTEQAAYLDSLLKSVQTLNSQAYAGLAGQVQRDIRQASDSEAAWNNRLYGSMASGEPLALVTADQVYAAALARPFQGTLLREVFPELGEARMRRMRDTIRTGFTTGKTGPQIVRELRGTKSSGFVDGFVEIDRRHLATVVNTALSHTAAVARERWEKENEDVVGSVMWLATLDSRTSSSCFPADTLTLPVGNVRGISRRIWNGNLVVVTTASGKKLRATPNHPVLTARGWRPIEEVKPGEDVLYVVRDQVGGVAAPKDIEMPATIGAVFDALREPAFCDVAVKGSSQVDFHGDGMVGEYEVNYPRSEGDLRLAFNAFFGHEIAEKLLVLVAKPGTLSAGGHLDLDIFRGWCAGMAAKLKSAPVQDFVESAFFNASGFENIHGAHSADEHIDNLSFVRSAMRLSSLENRHDAGALENSGDCGGGDPVDPTNRSGAFVPGIAEDDVVSVERELFSGHVYNLSTDVEFYIADGLIVHNCRLRDHKRYTKDTHKPIGHELPWGSGPGQYHYNCRSVSLALLPGQERLFGARASKGGSVDANMDYAQWLKRQSAEVQDEVLGPVRGKLYRQGGLTLEKFSTDRGEWLTIEQLRERDAKAFQRAGM